VLRAEGNVTVTLSEKTNPFSDLGWLIEDDELERIERADHSPTVIVRPPNEPGVRIIDGQRFYSVGWLNLLHAIYSGGRESVSGAELVLEDP
jgi:hypothetical protein